MKEVFIKALLEAAAANPRIMLVTADLGFGALESFATRFPKQYLNAGISEQNMTGLAAGLALEGWTVFTYSIANFPALRCLEQLRNDVCYHQANVKVVSIGGGMSYGSLGVSHHATEDLAILRALPEMTVVAPGDPWEVSEAVRAIAGKPGPAFLRLDKSWAETVREPKETFELGKMRKVREGSDAALIATGGILSEALGAAEILEKANLHCRVLSAHTVKPLDETAILEAARETGGILTIEEHTLDGGLGGAVAETLLDRYAMPGIFHRIGLKNGFCSIAGTQAYLRKANGLDAASIAATVESNVRARRRKRAQRTAA